MKSPPGQAVTGHPDSGLVAISSRHPAVGLAVGVIRDGHLRHFHGHGLADIVSRTPVTEDTVFRIGSITKTFTAVAVLQLCERGLIDLDAPAGGYLRAYRLIPAKPGHRPPTVRQLLTHTAGLPQLVYPARAFQPVLGETVACGQRVPALDEFYRGRLHLISEPGTQHTYSNHGFATLGQIWTDICGWYSFRGSLRDAQKWFVAGAEVFVRRGQLTLRPVTPLPALAHGLPLHPDDSGDPYVFRIDLSSLGIGTSRVVFSRSPNAVVNAFHLDLSFAPLSFDKQPAIRDPRYWVSSALGAVAAATTVNAVRRHRQYAPLRARGRALAAAAAAKPSSTPSRCC